MYSMSCGRYWSELMSAEGDLRTAAIFGGESARVLGKRNGSWVEPHKLTWTEWQDGGQDTQSVLLPQGVHPFAQDDWATSFVRDVDHCAPKSDLPALPTHADSTRSYA
jgi:hypothetical protein